jgi:NADPH-dependent 2,4-dienoyl-CoA reductase/sulfur reductase-like enzyme
MSQFSRLFSPLRVGSLELKNHFVVPPMATTLANEDCTISQALIDYRVARAWDILLGKKQAGLKVLVAGGGMVGCEVADFLGEHLHQVTLVEMLPEIALSVPPQIKYFLLQRLKDYGVRVETETKVVEFLEDGALVSKNGEVSRLDGFDTIVLAMGVRPVNYLRERLEGRVAELRVIGDALVPRHAIDAVEEGARAGVNV